MASYFNCSAESWHLWFWLFALSHGPWSQGEWCCPAGRAELTRTANPRELSDPQIIKGCLGHTAKSIIRSRDLTSFHKGQKKLTVNHSGLYRHRRHDPWPKATTKDSHLGSVFALSRTLDYALQYPVAWYEKWRDLGDLPLTYRFRIPWGWGPGICILTSFPSGSGAR